MILVIGGRAQGKLAFAKKELGVTDFSDGTLGDAACLYNFQEAVREGADKTALDAYLARYPDAVILCDEVGCGIVPMKKEERVWRENVGRLCCYLAGRAERVYRVFCGIGTRIK
ncbi:MAG: bifunctional adenosylcobinamide kinase/adenosylcobinamide-phosphate guanylyltransferase [Clostridiales bacterium]|nr:bifunctional adenosylcobinamide kinase/adenosylcobinamide-phosphate guanylyltransferase [Clostridiales bacterium]